MDQVNIIFLNGTSSSGKTVIAKALQEVLEGYYIHTGIDLYLRRTPSKFHVQSDGKEPPNAEGFLWVFQKGYKRVSEIRIGPVGLRLLKGMYRSIASLAETGIDLIIDDVVFDARVLQEAVNALHTFNVLFVGIRCPIAVAKQREVERTDRYQGLAEAHYNVVHSHGLYDLEVDTSILTPRECASTIKTRLQDGPTPNAIKQLRSKLRCR